MARIILQSPTPKAKGPKMGTYNGKREIETGEPAGSAQAGGQGRFVCHDLSGVRRDRLA